jgi:triosephosphate isomerase
MMVYIFINLKRFDVPKSLGGICLRENPREWIEWVIQDSIYYGLGKLDDFNIPFLLPEALIINAHSKLNSYPEQERKAIQLGSQGVYRENVEPGGNFGAFTTNFPAAAARNLGCTWTIVAHSEERKDKLGIIKAYDPDSSERDKARKRASEAVNRLVNQEALCALSSGLNVLMCVGETEAERGDGKFDEQKPRIRSVLKSQLEIGLESVKQWLGTREIVIGYEPIWAIGPGKTPPGGEYIGFVSSYIKETVQNLYGFTPPVVYGGGLKEDNAGMISQIETIDGGLVALTRFTGDIAFEPEGLKRIVEKYLENR